MSKLTGHQAVVSFVEFCPVIPHALLSSSFDGTCRIWNATDATVQPIVLHAGLEFATGRAAGDSSTEAGPSLSTRRAQQAAAQSQADTGQPSTVDSHVIGITVRHRSLVVLDTMCMESHTALSIMFQTVPISRWRATAGRCWAPRVRFQQRRNLHRGGCQ